MQQVVTLQCLVSNDRNNKRLIPMTTIQPIQLDINQYRLSSASILYDYLKLLNPKWKIIILIHEGKERGLADDKLFEKMITKTKGEK